MRELKFRAWDTRENEMFKIKEFKFSDGQVEIVRRVGFTSTGGYYTYPDQGSVILMQYTGLKDKNGKEIYEFDILSLPMRFHGDHTLKPSIAVMQWEHDGWYVEDQGECGYSEMEVIGNVWEHPELLAKE